MSLGSFLTTLLVARTLAPAEYGRYALMLGVVLVFVTFNGSLVTSRLSVEGATADRAALRRLAAASLTLTLGVAVPSSLGILGASRVLGDLQLAPLSVAALVCWQAQETVRRALMAHLHYAKALVGDVLSYIGQVAVVWTLAQRGQLSFESVFATVALTSALAGLVQAAQLGLELPTWGEVRGMAGRSWRLGRWLLLGTLASMVAIQGLPWTLALTYGPAGAASLQATINVMGVTHPVMFAVGNLVVPATARGLREGGMAVALRRALTYGALGAGLLLPYYLVVLLWPALVLRIFYGPDSPYLAIESVLRVYVLAYCSTYVAAVLTGVLTSLEKSRSVFLAQLTSAAGALALGIPLAATGGLMGAAVGAALAAAGYAVACVVLLRRAH